MARARRPSNARPDYLSPARPRVLAHRGLAVDVPENTLLAFAHAIGAGAEYVETDVQSSLDGAAVVCHDADLKRVAGRELRVEQLTLAELRRIDLGAGQSFCSLAEALDVFPETRFNIDLKAMGAVAPAAKAIRDLRAVDRVLVTSFSEVRRRAGVAALPGVATSASAPRFLSALLAARSGARLATARALRGLVAVQVPERAAGIRVTTPRIIDRLHEAGVEVHIWTVNDPDRMRELLDLGVDGIVTDRADLALDVVRSRK